MKVGFLIFALIVNSMSLLVKADEKLNQTKSINKILTLKESVKENKQSHIEIHIVKPGETLSSISSKYSIDKKLIINANNIKDENYIFIGQNLKIIRSISNGDKNIISNTKKYHVVINGETLTEIANKYRLKVSDIIEINNIENPNSIKEGSTLILRKPNSEVSTNFKSYGPLIITSKKAEFVRGRKIINAKNNDGKEIKLALKCRSNELDVKFPQNNWQGWVKAQKEFELKLLKDFC